MAAPPQSALGLAAAIARAETSAVAALASAFDRVDRYDGRINAVLAQDRPRAIAEAEAADRAVAEGRELGLLHGVPMTVKDAFDVAGMVTTNGLPWLLRNVAPSDAEAVARLRAAGAIVWGKTSLPFASYDWHSNHPLAGPCRNPWDVTRGPGGSSGGPAAALAAGYTTLELGSDLGGSIRLPAHCCGVWGLRPSVGRVPLAGHARMPGSDRELESHLVAGPMARDAVDLELAMGVLAGDAWGDVERRPLEGARVAWTGAPGGAPVDACTTRVLRETLERLEAAGAVVREVESPVDLDALHEGFGITHGYEFARVVPGLLRNPVGRVLMRRAWLPLKLGRSAFTHHVGRGLAASPNERESARAELAERVAAFQAWFRDVDFWLTPAAPTAAPPLRRWNRRVRVEGRKLAWGDFGGWLLAPFSALGHPIATVPAGLSGAGLPIGLQLHGRRGADERLLGFLPALQQILPRLAAPLEG